MTKWKSTQNKSDLYLPLIRKSLLKIHLEGRTTYRHTQEVATIPNLAQQHYKQ